MTTSVKILLIAAALGLSTAGYAVAQAPHHPGPAQPPPSGHAGMPGMPGMDHGGAVSPTTTCLHFGAVSPDPAWL